MSGFKPYPAYKNSGVEWLGEVPESWTAGTLRWYSTIQGGLAKGKDYEGRDTISLPYLRVANVQDGFVDLTEIKQISVLESELERYSLRAGDVLMNEGGDNDKLGRGAVWQGQIEPCLHQNHVFAIRPNDLLKSEWLAAFTGSQPARTYFFLSSKQSTNLASISASNIMSLVVPIPPVAEQTQVLRFLDHETARIDILIEEQQRLIELLKEKRQAVISHAVTKGLDPTMPMKDSGVEWLGEVPAHWQIGALKHFILPVPGAIKTGPFGSHLKSEDMKEGPYKVFNQRSVIDADFIAGDNFISEEKFAELRGFIAFPGDVLVTTRGTIGRAAILPDNAEVGILHPCLLRVQVEKSKLTSSYLCRLIQESHLLKTQLSLMSNSTTIEVIYSETMANLFIPVPTVKEQGQITVFLDDVIRKFGALTNDANESVRLLQERRSALISAAVTGKIDVRGWQPLASVSSPVLEEAV